MCTHLHARPLTGALGDIIRFCCIACGHHWRTYDAMRSPRWHGDGERSVLLSAEPALGGMVREMKR